MINSNVKQQPPVCTSLPGLLSSYTEKIVTEDLTAAKFLAMARLFFDMANEDSAVFFAAKSLYRSIVRVAMTDLEASFITNELGWQALRVATPCGPVDVVHERELDSIQSQCNGALIGKNSIVTYSKPQEQTTGNMVIKDFTHFSGLILLVADSCREYENNIVFIWDSAEMPTKLIEGNTYHFLADCPGVSPQVKAGQYWKLAIDEDDEGNMVYKWNQIEKPSQRT